MLRHLIDAAKGKHPITAARSSHWSTVRKHFLEKNPCCIVCGGTEKLEVHHRAPFHVHPELELEESNLVVLCEANPVFNCHRIFGHLNNFRGWNPDVLKDAKDWREKLEQNKERIATKAGD